ETVKKVTNDFENLHFNTGIAQMMVFINEGYKAEAISKEMAEGFIKLLYPVAPHLAEEVWQVLGHEETITYEAWPSYDETKLEEVALQNEKIQPWLEGKTVRKVIVIPNKLVNIVAN